MTADEFRAALVELDYSQEGFARLVGASPRTGQKWALGEARVPGCVALLLRLLTARPELVAVANGLGGTPPRARRAPGRKAKAA